MDQDVTSYGARPRPRRLCVRWGPRCPLLKRAEVYLHAKHQLHPSLQPFSHNKHGSKIWGAPNGGQTVGQIKMKLGMQVGLGPDHIVLDGDPAPLPQRGTAPQFLAHI